MDLFKKVSVSGICARLGYKRWNVYAALNSQTQKKEYYSQLGKVVEAAEAEIEELKSLGQSI